MEEKQAKHYRARVYDCRGIHKHSFYKMVDIEIQPPHSRIVQVKHIHWSRTNDRQPTIVKTWGGNEETNCAKLIEYLYPICVALLYRNQSAADKCKANISWRNKKAGCIRLTFGNNKKSGVLRELDDHFDTETLRVLLEKNHRTMEPILNEAAREDYWKKRQRARELGLTVAIDKYTRLGVPKWRDIGNVSRIETTIKLEPDDTSKLVPRYRVFISEFKLYYPGH